MNGITGRELRSQPAARPCCRLSDFHPPQLPNLSPPLTDVREMSLSVVSQLRDSAAKIASVRERLGLEAVLQVVLYFSTDESVPTPIVGFEHDVIAFLNVVGATIDVDSYK